MAKFLKEKDFLRGNLNFRILVTEDRRKLKFGEVSLQICQTVLRENRAKIFGLECPHRFYK